jgi:hypothetical protein
VSRRQNLSRQSDFLLFAFLRLGGHPDVSLSLPGCDAEPLRAFETVAVADHSSLLSHSSRALWIKPRTLQRSPDLKSIDAAARAPHSFEAGCWNPFDSGGVKS